MSEDALEKNLADTQAYYEERVRVAFEPLWGEHLHLGLFAAPDEPLVQAQERAVETMAAPLAFCAHSEVLEVACGLGAAARHLARRFGCRVLATNIAGRQLAQGRALARIQGFERRVAFAGADFHALPFADDRFDLWWCQEALLHSADKARVLAEARRVLRPDGQLVLSDITVPAAVGAAERTRILARVRSPGMWDAADYRGALEALGFEVTLFQDWSRHVAPSYAALARLIEDNRPNLSEILEEAELEDALGQFHDWVALARAGKIGWLYVLARK